jgi:hypothetical protein
MRREHSGTEDVGMASDHDVLTPSHEDGSAGRRLDRLLALMLFVGCAAVFFVAPIHQNGDSRYSLLLAESLARHGSFALERYGLPDPDYRLQTVGGHRYYVYPVGTSVLSVPFVTAMHAAGLSAVKPGGTYDGHDEGVLDHCFAALLMSAFASLAFFTSRLVLPRIHSVAIAILSAFGTQVFSSTSRAMWSDTWGIVLVGLAVFLLLEASARDKRLNVPLLATLLGVAFLVRPTNAVTLGATAVYLGLTQRARLWAFVLTAGAWSSLLVVYSATVFHSLVPRYYGAARVLRFRTPVASLLGNLISPSRGLFVYVPAVLAVALVLVS